MAELETTEEDVADQLAAESEFNSANQQFNNLIEEGQQFGSPSFLKYGFLFAVAGVVDIVDVADATGIGIIISQIVSIGGTAVIYLTLWLTNGKFKKAHQYGEDLEASVATFRTQVARIDQMSLRGAKAIGKIPRLKGVSRGARLARIQIKKFARKNPLAKILIGGAVNLVPFVAIINLMVFWIYLSYRDEKNAFRQAKEASEETSQQFESA